MARERLANGAINAKAGRGSGDLRLFKITCEAETGVYSTPWPHQVRDRRSVERIEAHWPLSISGTDGRWIDTTTEDLCSRGFYCVIPEIMQSGQEIDCRISIPDAASRLPDRWIQLLCRARVNRVEVRGDGYGLGCELRDYILLGGR